MAESAPVAKTSDIEDGGVKVVECDGEAVAIFRVGEEFYAISDTCPHAGGPLSEGFIEPDFTVSCPWHGWTFSLDPEDNRAPNDMLCKYRVHVAGDDLTLELVSGR